MTIARHHESESSYKHTALALRYSGIPNSQSGTKRAVAPLVTEIDDQGYQPVLSTPPYTLPSVLLLLPHVLPSWSSTDDSAININPCFPLASWDHNCRKLQIHNLGHHSVDTRNQGLSMHPKKLNIEAGNLYMMKIKAKRIPSHHHKRNWKHWFNHDWWSTSQRQSPWWSEITN